MSLSYLVLGTLLAAALMFCALRLTRERSERKRLAARLDDERTSAARRIQSLNDDLKNNALALASARYELESFSYSVAHDLRTPLRAISSYAEMLHQEFASQLPDEARRYLDVIRGGAGSMEKHIADLLAFAGLGRAPVKPEIHNPAACVRRACQEVLISYPGAAPRISVQDLPDAYGDAGLLRHVWFNLIDNAVKYSTKNTTATIEIGGWREDAQSVFFIKDDGAGFDMRFSDKLFGVSQRLHRQDEFPGTGVGLAIVKRVVDRHGGRVWAQGAVGSGAEFYFSLPREKAA